MERQGRHILLLCDNAPSHIYDASKYPHIRVEFFAPNLTAWIQPNDAGIIRCWKANYKRLFIQQAIERDDAGEDNIYKIDQLKAMSMMHAAWECVSSQTIRNCWAHTKISGMEPDAVPSTSSAPTEVHDVRESISALQGRLDELHGRAMATLTERTNAVEFARLEDTVPTEREWTDEEIVEQVAAEIQQAEADSRGETLDDDDDATGTSTEGLPNATSGTNVQPITTRGEALQSLCALQEYLSRLNNPSFIADLPLLSDINVRLSSL
ncbi:hypothetical protein RSAG8_00793, partial [Rhizoctonia solani AG-8 WAC10335]